MSSPTPTTSIRLPGVTLALWSENTKLGFRKMNALYMGHRTCPRTCALLDNGCYAQLGNVGVIARRMDRESADLDPYTIACNAATAIQMASAMLPLRLFVSGDVADARSASVISEAAVAYVARGGHPAYGYTHNWRVIPVETWRGLPIRASCETPAAVEEARARGYMTALITPPPLQRRAFMQTPTMKVVPCPEQTTPDMDCATCGLCLQTGSWAQSVTIGFAAHGLQKRKVIALLPVVE